MYILNDDTQNYPFYNLELDVETFELFKRNELTNPNSLKSPKWLSQENVIIKLWRLV